MAQVEARHIAAGRARASLREHLRRVRRRSLTVSVLLLVAVLLVATLPISLPVLAITDVLRPTRPWARVRATLAFTWIASCEVVGVAGAFVLWLGFLVHRNASWFATQNANLQRRWTDALFAGARAIFSMRVVTSGDSEDVAQGPVIVLVRHASSVDTVLSAAVLANPANLRLRYVLKDELLYDPCIDIVGNRLHNAFVSRSSKADLAQVRQLGYELGRDEGVLIYPEGTRFSAGKLARAKERLRAEGQLGPVVESLRYVMPPRPGGTLSLLRAACDADVLVVAHTGLEGAASLADVWRGELVGTTLRVDVRRVRASEIPEHARHKPEWLLQQWQRVDHWVAANREDAV